jgi:hypothetical protein
LVPLGTAVLRVAWRKRKVLIIDRRAAVLLSLAVILGAFPYVNAWIRTGNPAFPFVNALFKSPYFDTVASFNNELYNAPLTPWSLYDLVISSGRFIEGMDGALGIQWLPVIALALVGLGRRHARAQWLCLGLAVYFFVVVYLQQSYLRYLLPALILLAAFAAWTLQDLPDTQLSRTTILIVGAALCIVNLRLIPAASWSNATLCLKCSYDADSRVRFVGNYAPERIVSDYLNRTLPDGRIGFFLINGSSPSGYTGYSRSVNWHDWVTYRKIATPRDMNVVGEVARKHRLTHIVYAASDPNLGNDAIRAYAAQNTVPVWRLGDYVVAAIKPE